MLILRSSKLFVSLRITSSPLRLNPVPTQNRSPQCYSLDTPNHSVQFLHFSKTTLRISKLFRYKSCLRYSVTTLVDSMFFPRNSSFFQTILLRVNSMRFLCCSSLFSPLLLPSYAFRDCSFGNHRNTIPMPFESLRFLRHSRHFLSLPLPIYQTSRLSRSFCSPVSDSLAVCSSHRGNLYIRC